MPGWVIVGAAVVLAQAPASEPAHAANAVYRQLTGAGAMLAGHRVTLPAPLLRDGLSAESERAALVRLVGSERALADLTRDSVSAPSILKVRDERAGAETLIRLGDL